ncbi:hypothetical protein F7R12_09240 [Pseudomonas tolaasii]|nr:hypothetical protein F7R12_09240 [Pseudomonas tolaasii]
MKRQKRSAVEGDAYRVWACVGAGLPAMQTPRYLRQTRLMPSQASQLPQLIFIALGDAPA